MIKKIVITGPESSGKSWLCTQLAAHYKAPFVSEYARIFLEQHGSNYNFNTLVKIIEGHRAHQQKALSTAKNFIFLDTDLINFKVWEDVVFKKNHDFLEAFIAKESDHIYLITYPDLPWKEDPLREHPEERLLIFEAHRAEIEKWQRPYQVVSGIGNERLECAIRAIDQLLS